MGRLVARTILLLAAVTLPFFVAYLFLSFASSEPDTATLDSDLREVAINLSNVDAELKQYGGTIGTVLQLRRQLLLTTRDMINQKRLSLLRRVYLNYSINGGPAPSPNEQRMAEIQAEMQKSSSEANASDAEAAQYSGGLIQSLALMKAATERVNIAQLKMSYLFEKYGVPITAYAAVQGPPTGPSKDENVVTDGDAL